MKSRNKIIIGAPLLAIGLYLWPLHITMYFALSSVPIIVGAVLLVSGITKRSLWSGRKEPK